MKAASFGILNTRLPGYICQFLQYYNTAGSPCACALWYLNMMKKMKNNVFYCNYSIYNYCLFIR